MSEVHAGEWVSSLYGRTLAQEEPGGLQIRSERGESNLYSSGSSIQNME